MRLRVANNDSLQRARLFAICCQGIVHAPEYGILDRHVEDPAIPLEGGVLLWDESPLCACPVAAEVDGTNGLISSIPGSRR